MGTKNTKFSVHRVDLCAPCVFVVKLLFAYQLHKLLTDAIAASTMHKRCM